MASKLQIVRCTVVNELIKRFDTNGNAEAEADLGKVPTVLLVAVHGALAKDQELQIALSKIHWDNERERLQLIQDDLTSCYAALCSGHYEHAKRHAKQCDEKISELIEVEF